MSDTIFTSSDIVEAFAATRLTPVWENYGDGTHTACAVTVLEANGPGPDEPTARDALIAGWDDCSLERTSSDEYRYDLPQRHHANLASVQMRCSLHRVARGRWQQEILAHLIAHGCIANPMSSLAGRARSEAGNYRRSLDSLLCRLAATGPWPLYRVTDRTGRVWYATCESPDGPAYPLRSVSQIGR